MIFPSVCGNFVIEDVFLVLLVYPVIIFPGTEGSFDEGDSLQFVLIGMDKGSLSKFPVFRNEIWGLLGKDRGCSNLLLVQVRVRSYRESLL